VKDKIKLEKEFIERIMRHHGILNKICFVYMDSNMERDDLKQEIILQLWKSYPNFQGGSSFSTWMYRVALNTALTFRKKNRTISFARVDDQLVDPGPSMDYSEDIQTLYRAIARLNKIEKAIILLWLEEKTYQEIAATMGISEKNVGVKLVRIKSKLASWIKDF